jgi:hypothetical protein
MKSKGGWLVCALSLVLSAFSCGGIATGPATPLPGCPPKHNSCIVPSGGDGSRCAFRCVPEGFVCPQTKICKQMLTDEGACTPESCGPPPQQLPQGAVGNEFRCDDGSFGGYICTRDPGGRCGWGMRFCPFAVQCTDDDDCLADQHCRQLEGKCPPEGVPCSHWHSCMLVFERLPRRRVQTCETAADCRGPVAAACAQVRDPAKASGPASVVCAHWACPAGVCLPEISPSGTNSPVIVPALGRPEPLPTP